jgi:hypothetical protein
MLGMDPGPSHMLGKTLPLSYASSLVRTF